MGDGRRVWCVGCGYDLFGLPPEGMCPECGLGLSESLERKSLWDAEAGWLRAQMVGVWLFFGTLVVVFGWPFVAGWVRSFMPGVEWAGYYIESVVVSGMAGGAGWCLSRASPLVGRESDEAGWRRTVGILTVLWLVSRGVEALRMLMFTVGTSLTFFFVVGGVTGLCALAGVAIFGYRVLRSRRLLPGNERGEGGWWWAGGIVGMAVLILLAMWSLMFVWVVCCAGVMGALADWTHDEEARRRVRRIFYAITAGVAATGPLAAISVIFPRWAPPEIMILFFLIFCAVCGVVGYAAQRIHENVRLGKKWAVGRDKRKARLV